MGIRMVYKPYIYILYIYISSGWWFGTMELYDFPETVGNGMSSSQWTKSIIFQRGRVHPPTRFILWPPSLTASIIDSMTLLWWDRFFASASLAIQVSLQLHSAEVHRWQSLCCLARSNLRPCGALGGLNAGSWASVER